MQIHNIKKNKSNKTSIRVGRGGKRGKTSGKGHKGQSARTGNSSRPEIRDMIKKLPKLRGYRFKSVQESSKPVNLSQLEATFETGDNVSPKEIVKAGLVNKKSGKIPTIKILGTGDITKKLKIKGCTFSKTAQEKIEKAGGTIK
jgi:large subunit ribosomal protein L15